MLNLNWVLPVTLGNRRLISRGQTCETVKYPFAGMSVSTDVSQSGQIVRDSSTPRNINKQLNSSKTRLEGLKELNLFLPRCPDEDFRNFCVTWMQNCCKMDGLTKSRNYTVHLLCDLLKTSSNYPELKKAVSFFITTRYFDFFFKYLLNSEAGWICTKTCLCHYRGACGPFQDSLEKHLTNEIEKNMRISVSKAQCFALLPSTGGGGNDGINYRKNWKAQFVRFLNICNSVLSDLLSDVEDFQLQEYEAHDNKYNTNRSERNIEHLAMQFQNYCKVLEFMLLIEYPALKNIPSDLIFHLICRGLAANPKTLGRRQTTDISTLQKVLPEIHRANLSLLKAVIVTCKNQLLPYSHLISKLIKQSLQWTESDFAYANENPFGRLRISIYETLCNWLAFARSGSCIETISDVVVSNAINDMRSKKGVVFLKGGRSQNRSKGREETILSQADVTVDGTLCHAALKVLQFLLRFAGALLKAEVHKSLQEVVVKTLIEIQKSSAPDLIVPFDGRVCRTELYSLLLELTHQPCPKWPPPTSFALALFAGGLNDGSPEVSSFCSAALSHAAVIIHPQYDNGGFLPLDLPERSGRAAEEPRWMEEPMELVNGNEVAEVSQEENSPNKENRSESGETDPLKTASDATEGSEFSSDEDSRNTVTFSKEAAELSRGALPGDHEKEEVLLEERNPAAEGDADTERPTAAGEILAEEKRISPADEGPREILRVTPERKRMKKPSESDRAQDSDGPKSISPESTSGDGHPKGRYFLRSKTKASSEEPEEASRRTCSPDSAKSTPAKTAARMTPGAQSSGKRRRTRALSRAGGHGEPEADTPGKSGHDDEEDITAAFDDSFVD